MQVSILGWLGRAVTIDRQTADDFSRIAVLLQKYSDMPMGFADASLVALAERIGTHRIATFDSDFDVYRLNNKNEPFENLSAAQR